MNKHKRIYYVHEYNEKSCSLFNKEKKKEKKCFVLQICLIENQFKIQAVYILFFEFWTTLNYVIITMYKYAISCGVNKKINQKNTDTPLNFMNPVDTASISRLFGTF